MSRRPFILIALWSAAATAVLWQLGVPLLAPPEKTRLEPAAIFPAATAEPITPIPASLPLDAAKVALGERLFHDPRLSPDGGISCSTCHPLSKAGADGLKRSLGIGGQEGAINAPTVFNSGFNFRQFWNGRAASLEDQVDGPLHDLKEMGSNWTDVVKMLERDAAYVAEFSALYRDGVQPSNIKDAIATFERSLITPHSRFDKFLMGDQGALAADEIRGYRLFKTYGCIACHQGVNVGGNLFERLGVMSDFFAHRGDISQADLGRFAVTGDPDHKHVFKVPGLRNVALTAPYFHDGSVPTLELAVLLMGQYQLGIAIPAADVALIVKFLHTLNGEYGGKPL